jgi:von Willebrand factor type A domain/Aerotolerance regulator N-terminal
MPFSLESPAGLWLLALIVPLVALYVLKIRRERMRVASTWLWAAAERDLLAQSPFKRLVAQVPLLLQLAALVLLALALGRPATRGGAILGEHVAIVVDTSASMSAKDAHTTTRMAAARQAAHEVVQSLGPDADALLVDAGHDALVAAPLDRDRRRLDAAIDRLRARDVEGRLGRAVALAADRLRALAGTKRLVVITDGDLAQPGSLANVSLPLDVIRVGSPVDNAAIVRVDVRDGVDPTSRHDEVQAFALVANYGKKRRDLFVTLHQKNVVEPLASRRIQLQPGESTPVVLTFEPAKSDVGTGLIVELEPGDAMPVDDRAYARVPLGRELPVVMAPKDASPWFQRALLADPDVDLMGTSLAALGTADVPDGALVVVTGACPPVTPGGDLLVLDPPPGRCRSSVVGDKIDHPAITSWAESDARMRFLTLDGVVLSSAREIETDGPEQSLVRTRQGTVVSDISEPGRSGTLISFAAGDSNWPLKASFVLFVRNVLELARAHRARGVTGPAETGEPLTVRVPPDVSDVKLVDPTGAKQQLSAHAGLVIVPEVARAGFYFLSWQGRHPGSVLVAANLTNAAESRLGGASVASHAARAAARAQVVAGHTEWRWLMALVALLLIVLDAWWLTRRPRARGPSTPAPRRPERGRSRADRSAA